MYCVQVLEARSPKSRSEQGWFFLRALKEGCVPGLFLWLADGRLSLCLFIPSSLYVCLCVQISPFYKDTSHTGLGPILLQFDLILTNYICNDPISK